MHVRNEMEDFHVKYLSDAQMKELSPIIRQAIFDVVSFTNQPPKGKIENNPRRAATPEFQQFQLSPFRYQKVS